MDKLLFKLEVYEGPLDLLLDLIKKNKIDIFDIDIFLISEQYFEYLKNMEKLNMDITSDFIVMASTLLLIKSKLLLPTVEENEEEDPRKDLTWALLEYQKCKKRSEALTQLRIKAGDTFTKPRDVIEFPKRYRSEMNVSLMRNAYIRVLQRNAKKMPPKAETFTEIIKKEIYPVSEKLKEIKRRLRSRVNIAFKTLFSYSRSRSEIVATFLAALELIAAERITVSEDENGTITLHNKDAEV